ncbi:MAG: tyrosine-type recombinase/integrase, partial [Bacteroidales bacterium]|nr:tyrosine-type recombinase/integrase [Bacteroidales bacterium]
QNFITYLENQGLQRGTVRLYFQKLACVLNDAYKNELFDERILRRVKRPKREQSKKSFLTERELKRLFSTAMPEKYDNMKNMFLFSCSTGLRFSDVANLQWKNVKSHNKHLLLEYHQQKTNTNEVLPLCAQAETLLRSLKHKGVKVFGHELSQEVNKFLKRWCKAAKIRKRVSFHTARHSFCVMLLTYDVSIYTVQQLMCHSDINSTKVYADILNKTKNKAVKKLPMGGKYEAKRA